MKKNKDFSIVIDDATRARLAAMAKSTGALTGNMIGAMVLTAFSKAPPEKMHEILGILAAYENRPRPRSARSKSA